MFNCGSISQKTHRALRDIKDLKKNFKMFFFLLFFIVVAAAQCMKQTVLSLNSHVWRGTDTKRVSIHSAEPRVLPLCAPLRRTENTRAQINKHINTFFFQPTVKSQQRVRLPRTHLQTRGIHKFRSSAPSALSFKVAVSA